MFVLYTDRLKRDADLFTASVHGGRGQLDLAKFESHFIALVSQKKPHYIWKMVAVFCRLSYLD